MLARVIGRTRWEVALSADPEDLAAHRALVEAHQPFQNFEYLLPLNQNDKVWLSVNGEPVNASLGLQLPFALQTDGSGRAAVHLGNDRMLLARQCLCGV